MKGFSFYYNCWPLVIDQTSFYKMNLIFNYFWDNLINYRFRDRRGGGGFRDDRRGGGRPIMSRGGGFGAAGRGKVGKPMRGSKQPGVQLRKPRWDMGDLQPFRKDFYIPHNTVSNR